MAATVVGKPRQEDYFIGDYLQELLSPLFPLVMPAVKDLWSYGQTGFHSLAAAVVKERYAREALGAGFRILGEGQLSLTKFLMLTDKPQSFFVREFVREAVLETLRGEVPHAVAVSIDKFEELEKLVRIAATVHVEKVGQRKILVGAGGQSLKAIGTQARQRIEKLVERKVYLELFVRVTPRWKNVPRQLAELGYEAPSEGEQS